MIPNDWLHNDPNAQRMKEGEKHGGCRDVKDNQED
jgi:hypothetical protein